MRHIALAVALVIYAFYGSPTPATFGWPEIVIGVCLFTASGPANLIDILSGLALWRGPAERRFLTACFLILLIPLTITGLSNGHPLGDVLRDVIPLGFFFLPLFLSTNRNPCASGDPSRSSLPVDPRLRKGYEVLLYRAVIAIGVMFALRFWPTSGINILRFGEDRSDEKFLYLSNSPTLIFAGLTLVFEATTITPRHISWRIAAIIGGLLCLSVLAVTLQRGPLLLGMVMIYSVFLHRFLRTPHFLFFLWCSLGILGLFFGQYLYELLTLIWNKTLTVGDNARFAEFHSVVDVLGDDPWSWLFGKGWGARVITAASGHADVRYTHSLISYALLKGGAIGLLATAAYGAFMARTWGRTLLKQPLVACATLPSLILGFTVYPSFKMLCFGAMLALITCASIESPEHDRT